MPAAFAWHLLTLTIVMLGGLLLLAAALVLLMSLMILRPPRMVGGRALGILGRLSPTDLGLPYESLRFEVPDSAAPGRKLAITTWWLPNPAPTSDRCVILLHGYADAKVGAIAWAPLWQSLGYHILAIDARAHGESDGRYCTAGFFERHDLDAVINQLRAANPPQTRRLVLFGISMGAAIALATAARRTDIDAVILDCPYSDFRHACFNHARLTHLPSPLLQQLALRLGEWRSKASFDDVRPIDLIPQLPCPLLVIQSGQDPLVPPADARQIEQATERLRARDAKSEYWLVADADHILALRDHTSDYNDHLAVFLRRAAP